MLLCGRVCIGVQILLNRLVLIIRVRVVVAAASPVAIVILAAIVERHSVFVDFI